MSRHRVRDPLDSFEDPTGLENRHRRAPRSGLLPSFDSHGRLTAPGPRSTGPDGVGNAILAETNRSEGAACFIL